MNGESRQIGATNGAASRSFGIITLAWQSPFTSEDLPLVERVAALGYDSLEIFLEDPSTFDVRAARSALESASLEASICVQLNSARDPSSADDASRQAGIAYLRDCVDVAASLGGSIVGGPLYGDQIFYGGTAPEDRSRAEAEAMRARAVDSLRRVADHAAGKDVVLAVEPLNRFETSVACLAKHGLELVDEIDHPSVGVLLDSYHMNIEEPDPAAAIRLVGSRLVHFHANENHRGAPGTGHVDWDAIGSALNAVGYSGAVVTEPFRRPTLAGDTLALWRPPADPQAEDGVAGEALAFLQERLG